MEEEEARERERGKEKGGPWGKHSLVMPCFFFSCPLCGQTARGGKTQRSDAGVKSHLLLMSTRRWSYNRAVVICIYTCHLSANLRKTSFL